MRISDWSSDVCSSDLYVARERIAGLLVISHGKVVLEKYGLGQKPEDKWISFSVAKSVTSTLLGAAIRDGKIKSVDDLVTTYIPELKGGAYDGRSEEHTSELQSLMRISYAVFCLKKKKKIYKTQRTTNMNTE